MLAALCAAASTRAGQAQTPGRTQARCNGQTVTEIIIRTQAPSFGGIFKRLPWLAGFASSLHVTTSPDVVRRFVLLERGAPCSATRRYETERILRAQPFIAEASVTAYADGIDGVRIEVVTVDEAATIIAPSIKTRAPYLTAMTLGSSNLNGQGVFARGAWRHGGVYRDTWRGQFTDYQVFDRPIQLELKGARRDLGSEWSAELAYPFLTSIQRAGWNAWMGESHDFAPFLRLDGDPLAIQVRRAYAAVGGMVRFGRPNRLLIAGASLSGERAEMDEAPVALTTSGLRPDSTPELVKRYASQRSVRLNALLGMRNISFMRVAAFDALSAEQDVRRGVQVGAMIGRGTRALGSLNDDIYVGADVYAGAGSPNSFVAGEVLADTRRADANGDWDAILMSGRLAWYVRPHARHTVVASGEYSAGWRQREPFQLSLGDRRGGVRGYEGVRVGGGQRRVVRLEDRWLVGNVRGSADIGIAFFADAGVLRAGDAPLGVDTKTASSLGIGLLAAVPPRSQRIWRLDLAFPLTAIGNGKWGVRFSNSDNTRQFWVEPRDVRRSRDRAVPASVFTWP